MRKRNRPKMWAMKWKLWGLWFCVSNCRIKKRGSRPEDLDLKKQNRMRLYEQQGHRCAMCGREFEYRQLQLHHILPWRVFLEYRYDLRNMVEVCNDCHNSIHKNPYKNLAMQEEKAKELGINLSDYYD